MGMGNQVNRDKLDLKTGLKSKKKKMGTLILNLEI